MKKILVVLITLILSVALFSACAPQSEQPPQVIVLDGVDKGTNKYVVSENITSQFDSDTNTVKLYGDSWYVTPWFSQSWTTYNYVTVGIKLPDNFKGADTTSGGEITGKSVWSSAVLRYDVQSFDPATCEWEVENQSYWKKSVTGDGTTPIATEGGAVGYFDFSFAANSQNTKKDNLVKVAIVFNEGETAVIYTIDISELTLHSEPAPQNTTE